MPRLSIWNSGKKSADYRFFDRTISEYFGAGGTSVLVHLYLGVHEQTGVFTPSVPGGAPAAPAATSERTIQDVLFLENRDRKYSDTVYDLRGIYNVTDIDFDMRQFGLFLQNDTLFIEFHLNDMIAQCGRRLIPGDVIELPHQRDDTIPGGIPAMNKYYVVEEANRASSGYSATWFAHIWRVKVNPMPASQEFEDILEKNAVDPLGFQSGKIGSLFSTLGTELGLNEEVVEQAKADVTKRYFETQHFWMLPDTEGVNPERPWLFAGGGDAIPPNGAALLGSGTGFPNASTLQQGDYYLRTDYQPPTLFQWQDRRWIMKEVDWRGTEWSVAHRLLKTFVNLNTSITMEDGLVLPQKQNLSQVLKPRADF